MTNDEILKQLCFESQETFDFFKNLLKYSNLSEQGLIEEIEFARLKEMELSGKLCNRQDDTIRIAFDILTTKLQGNLKFTTDKSFIFEENKWITYPLIKDTEMAKFLYKLLIRYTLDLKKLIHLSSILIKFFVTKDNGKKDTTIQLDNCYIKNKKIIEGYYKENFPRVVIKRKYEPNGNKDCPEFMDLLLHLCNNDEDTREWLIERMASILILDVKFRSKWGQMIRFYGPTGGNGKSTFVKFLRLVFGSNNVYSASLDNLGTKNNYDLSNIINSLIAVDEDSTESYYSTQTMALQKTIITGETMSTREIYGKPEQNTPITTLFAMSNFEYLSEDKTDSMKRRLTEIHTEGLLIRSDSWFEKLFSEEQAQAFFNFIMNKVEEILKRPNQALLNDTNYISNRKEELRRSNNNVLDFIDVCGDKIEGYSVRYVANEYAKFCEINDLNALGKIKFNQTLKVELGLTQKAVRLNNLKDYYETPSSLLENENSVIKAWLKK